MFKFDVDPKSPEENPAITKFLIRARLAKCNSVAWEELEMLRSIVDRARPSIEAAGFRAALSKADAIRPETDAAVRDVAEAWLKANGMELATEP